MRLRDLQEILAKFTNGQKGTMISDCPVYIETMTGHLEDVRRIEIQESNIIGDANPARLVIKADKNELFNISDLIFKIISKYQNSKINLEQKEKIIFNGRKNLIQRCLDNLIGNALKYAKIVNIKHEKLKKKHDLSLL